MLSLLLLVACPAPTDFPAEPPTQMGAPGQGEPQPSKGPTPEGVPETGPATAQGPVGPDGAPSPGAAPIPPGGAPASPPADGTVPSTPPDPNAPGGLPVTTIHPDREFQVTGTGVKVSGSVTYAGGQKGTIRVDFLRAQERPGFPEIVGSLSLKAPGPFSVDVPQSLGKVQIVSYIDGDGNGPSEGEAFGHAPKDVYDIETTAITGIDITLKDEPNEK